VFNYVICAIFVDINKTIVCYRSLVLAREVFAASLRILATGESFNSVYSCLVGSFLNSTTATRPDPTRLVCDPTKSPYMSRLNRPGLRPKKSRKSRRPHQTSRPPDQTLSATRVADKVWSGRSSGF